MFHNEPGAWARAILNYDSGYLVAGYKQNGPVSEACFFRLSDNLALNTNANTFWGALSFFIDDIVALQSGVYALVGNEGGGRSAAFGPTSTAPRLSRSAACWAPMTRAKPDSRAISMSRLAASPSSCQLLSRVAKSWLLPRKRAWFRRSWNQD